MATDGPDLLSASSVNTFLTSLTKAQLEIVGRACRFWAKVDIVHDDDSCWNWTASLLSADGYGQFEHGLRAHRVAYELTVGPIPGGLHILHSCDNKRCVRPIHLRAGTRSENLREAVAHGIGVGRRKLSNAQVKEIREAVAAGLSRAELANKYGVNVETIHRVVRYITHREEVMPDVVRHP